MITGQLCNIDFASALRTMESPGESESSNPYQPPVSAPMLNVDSRRFVCPQCDTALPFTRLWLMQPMGRCPVCRTRLVVRRRGFHKLWTPALLFVCGLSSMGLTVTLGLGGILFVPLLLLLLGSFDAAIAYRIGYFDRPRWIF